MIQKKLALAGILISFLAFDAQTHASAKPTELQLRGPILVELFTSEGCSSCPAADDFLSQLAKADRKIVLVSQHVDYWNYLGWADPFSNHGATTKQQEYCSELGVSSPYTPQAVINGTYECIGSNRRAVLAALKQADLANRSVISMSLLQRAEGKVDIGVKFTGPAERADLLLLLVEDDLSVNVERGENRGRRLSHDGVIRASKRVTDVRAGIENRVSFPFDKTNGDHLRMVAILQNNNRFAGVCQIEL